MIRKKEISLFMEYYYNQNYDMVFGNLRNSIIRFCSDNGMDPSVNLVAQVIELRDSGVIKNIQDGQSPHPYWDGMGGMMILPEDISEFEDVVAAVFD